MFLMSVFVFSVFFCVGRIVEWSLKSIRQFEMTLATAHLAFLDEINKNIHAAGDFSG